MLLRGVSAKLCLAEIIDALRHLGAIFGYGSSSFLQVSHHRPGSELEGPVKSRNAGHTLLAAAALRF